MSKEEWFAPSDVNQAALNAFTSAMGHWKIAQYAAFERVRLGGMNKFDQETVWPELLSWVFSAELLLKCISLIAQGRSRRGHFLLPLYDSLPESVRLELCELFADRVAKHEETKAVHSAISAATGNSISNTLPSVLEAASKLYVIWRYQFDQDQFERMDGNSVRNWGVGNVVWICQSYVVAKRPEFEAVLSRSRRVFLEDMYAR